MKTTFRVSRNYPKALRERKRRITRRLAPRNWEPQEQPVIGASNIRYDLSAKTRANSYGGVGAVHLMAQRLGLVEEIEQHLHLLKVHLPYHARERSRAEHRLQCVGGRTAAGRHRVAPPG